MAMNPRLIALLLPLLFQGVARAEPDAAAERSPFCKTLDGLVAASHSRFKKKITLPGATGPCQYLDADGPIASCPMVKTGEQETIWDTIISTKDQVEACLGETWKSELAEDTDLKATRWTWLEPDSERQESSAVEVRAVDVARAQKLVVMVLSPAAVKARMAAQAAFCSALDSLIVVNRTGQGRGEAIPGLTCLTKNDTKATLCTSPYAPAEFEKLQIDPAGQIAECIFHFRSRGETQGNSLVWNDPAPDSKTAISFLSHEVTSGRYWTLRVEAREITPPVEAAEVKAPLEKPEAKAPIEAARVRPAAETPGSSLPVASSDNDEAMREAVAKALAPPAPGGPFCAALDTLLTSSNDGFKSGTASIWMGEKDPARPCQVRRQAGRMIASCVVAAEGGEYGGTGANYIHLKERVRDCMADRKWKFTSYAPKSFTVTSWEAWTQPDGAPSVKTLFVSAGMMGPFSTEIQVIASSSASEYVPPTKTNICKAINEIVASSRKGFADTRGTARGGIFQEYETSLDMPGTQEPCRLSQATVACGLCRPASHAEMVESFDRWKQFVGECVPSWTGSEVTEDGSRIMNWIESTTLPSPWVEVREINAKGIVRFRAGTREKRED